MKKPASLQNAVVFNYLELAHSDYKVSRHLLRNGFMEHGAMLAATAAEKYLKAIIGVHGISNSDHLGGALYKLVSRCQQTLYESLDKDFLKFLEKAYKLRYATASSPGLAIVINQYRTLFAIDDLIARVDAGFQLRINGKTANTPYQTGVQNKDLRLVEDNVAVTPSSMATIIQRNNKVIELKIENDYSTLRVEYETVGVNLNGSFTKIPKLSVSKSTFMLSRG